MNRLNIEMAVGLFLVMGIASFGYIAIMLGGVDLFDKKTYTVHARFLSASGLKEGAPVEVAGVIVGKVGGIRFDTEHYEAVVDLRIPEEVKLQEDSIASIRSTGIIGSKFVKLTPGGADELLEDGGEITETESSVSLEELISKYIFESK